MILKEVKYKNSNPKIDWEEIPDEDLYEDGELNDRQVTQKILNKFYSGDWKLIRRIDE